MDHQHHSARTSQACTMSAPISSPPQEAAQSPRVRKAYVPAVGPRLRKLLYLILAMLAVLGANSIYLAAITTFSWASGRSYEDWFYQWMFLAHLVLGLVFVAPFAVFAVVHLVNTRKRKNRRAVRAGYGLFVTSIAVLLSGGVLLALRLSGASASSPSATSIAYWAHVVTPLLAVWMYWLHRLAGPPIKWRIGLAYSGVVGVGVVAMAMMHAQDPREWFAVGPQEGEQYFMPSLARTTTGKYIPAATMMMNDYCQRCHADAHAAWSDSVHRFSSFNNPAYLASVRETRDVSLKRDGSVKASRWCAGCHDPVPFFSGAFDDANYDLLHHPTAHAGITCTVCHAITHVNSTRGNADFTIEEPQHYPFAASDNEWLQWINNQLVKAKPAMHKQTFLKPFHKTAEFCSTCHKVHLPRELNHYKDFLRGQNHYDTYLLSGVSGHGARSFYYPEQAKHNCAECHMPLAESGDFGAKFFDDSGELKIHNHLFPTANTGVAWLRGKPEVIAAHQEFMKDIVRVDLFGVREGSTIDAPLVAPVRPQVPALKPGGRYLLETVIRTLKLGHPLTQGTVDSNELWLDVTVTSGGRVIGRSGGLDRANGNEVDPWAHFVNVFMLDRNGNRIDRRNPQDIFVPLYNHQIPPGAGWTVHYGLQLPADVQAPVTVELKLQYRKFDTQYMRFVAQQGKVGGEPIRGLVEGAPYLNELPITTLAVDRVTFPVEGVADQTANSPRDIPQWQRWNDYGIGLLLKGKAELRQAAEAFTEVEQLGRFDGPLNLSRVYFEEGRIDEAATAIRRAAAYDNPAAPPWTMAWMSGQINRQLGRLAEAEHDFRKVLEDRTPEMGKRGFDFSLDYEVRNLLGLTLFDLASQVRGSGDRAERERLLREAVREYQKTLQVDSENVTAHYNLQLLYAELGDEAKAREHQQLHARYKPDDNAADRAVRLAREKYPAANHAAEAVVIYPLQRSGAPELPANQTSGPNTPSLDASSNNVSE
jgi:tetratricopeptide (TPR) repeat protein